MRMKAPAYITERRMADKGWVRRWKRSLGRNGHFRARVRAAHELRDELQKLAKEDARERDLGLLATMASQRNSIGRFAKTMLRAMIPRRANV